MPERRRLWMKFAVAMLYFSGLAKMISSVNEGSFFLTLLIVFVSAIVCGGLAVLWLTLWAQRENSRLGQFTVGSFFFLMVYVSLFFSLVRWGATQGGNPSDPLLITLAAVICLGLVLASLPFLLLLTESLLWFLAWLAHRLGGRRNR